MKFEVLNVRLTWQGSTPRVAFDLATDSVTKSYDRLAPAALLADDKSNTKLAKSRGLGWRVKGLSLEPHKVRGLTGNLCPKASAGCAGSCLTGSGLGGFLLDVHAGRVLRRVLWYGARDWFLARLDAELRKASERGDVAVRLNVFSDIRWEEHLDLASYNCQFYDYTKWVDRAGLLLPNYWLTLSRSEDNTADCIAALQRGANVAVAFAYHKNETPPQTWRGFQCVDGDTHDLRFTDPRGVRGKVIRLRLKSFSGVERQAAIDSGFAVKVRGAS